MDALERTLEQKVRAGGGGLHADWLGRPSGGTRLGLHSGTRRAHWGSRGTSLMLPGGASFVPPSDWPPSCLSGRSLLLVFIPFQRAFICQIFKHPPCTLTPASSVLPGEWMGPSRDPPGQWVGAENWRCPLICPDGGEGSS